MELENDPVKPIPPRAIPLKLKMIIGEAASLAVTTVILLGVYVTSYLAATGAGNIFENTTAQVSDKYFTQVTPAGFTFAIWGIIYLWQGLWVAYAWSFLCRPNAYRTITTGVYVGFAIVNALNITWLFLWGYQDIIVAAGVLFSINMAFYPTIGLLVSNFYKNSSKSDNLHQTLTWVLPINGLFFYVTWTTIASLINLTVVLQYTNVIGTFTATQSGTVALSLLLIILGIYFTLENTVLFNTLRYVFSVYPVVIWALVGELSAHWGAAGEEKNSWYTLGLLLVTVVLFVVRIVRLIGAAGVIKTSRPKHYESLSVL